MVIARAATSWMMLFCIGAALASPVDAQTEHEQQMMHHDMERSAQDGRVSLGLSAEMKQHQLINMRSHLVAVQSIINSIADGEFAQAAQAAHAQLGLTEEMKNMCNMFDDENFRTLGLAFHESGDALGDALQTGDTTKSLQALQVTMGYCVQCHATYRQ